MGKRKKKTRIGCVATNERTAREDPDSGPRRVAREPPVDEDRAMEIRELDDPIDERRDEPRVPVKVEIDFASESQFFAGLSGDLSEVGVFVETYREMPVGCAVALELALPSGTVRAVGSVRWHRGASDSSTPGLGIALAGLSAHDERTVHAFCRERAPLYYELDLAS